MHSILSHSELQSSSERVTSGLVEKRFGNRSAGAFQQLQFCIEQVVSCCARRSSPSVFIQQSPELYVYVMYGICWHDQVRGHR